MSNTKKNSYVEILEDLNHPSTFFMVALALVVILFASTAWTAIAGLYFALADLFLIVPYGIYFVFTMMSIGSHQGVNKTKLVLVGISALLVFSPALYLVLTDQITIRLLLTHEFDPNLNHLPFAPLIPWIAVAMILTPVKDYLATRKSESEE